MIYFLSLTSVSINIVKSWSPSDVWIHSSRCWCWTFSQFIQLYTVTHQHACKYCDSNESWGGLPSLHAAGINKHLPLLLLQVKQRTSVRSPVQTDKGISAPFAPSVWIRRRCSAPRCTTKVSGTRRGEPCCLCIFHFKVPKGLWSALTWSPTNHSLTYYWANSCPVSVQHAHSSEALTRHKMSENCKWTVPLNNTSSLVCPSWVTVETWQLPALYANKNDLYQGSRTQGSSRYWWHTDWKALFKDCGQFVLSEDGRETTPSAF